MLPPLGNLSVWQRSVRAHPLLSPSGSLPESTPILVVGGGLCGAVLAHALVSAGEEVVLLEARELASGASGRNAGHCRPDPSRGFTAFQRTHGPEEARKILESEGLVLKLMDDFVRDHKIDCEWTLRKTHDVSLSEEFTEYSAAAERGLRSAGGDSGTVRSDGEAAAAATGMRCSAAWSWDAATVNPAQLTLGVHQLCVESGRCRVFAHTRVLRTERTGEGWTVTTDRGTIVAGKVVWANNAYVAETCPEFEGIVVPVRAQAHKLRPPPAPLGDSCSLRHSLSRFYSVAPRPDGSIVLGVSRGHVPASETRGVTDDSGFRADLAHAAMAAWAGCVPGYAVPSLAELEKLQSRVQDPKEVALREEDIAWTSSGLEYAWSGVIGCTPDLVPLIGPRIGFEGQFVAVGYHGHGMARILLTAPALARYILTGEWDAAMPASFRTSSERMERLRRGVDEGTMCAA